MVLLKKEPCPGVLVVNISEFPKHKLLQVNQQLLIATPEPNGGRLRLYM